VVVVNVRADKEVSPHVVADAAAKVHQEAVVAGEIVASEAVGAIGQIEASALHADATHEIKADLLAQLGLVHGVEVRDDGTIRLTEVISLRPPPSSLKAESDAFAEDDVGANTGVKATLFGTEAGCWAARPRRYERATAEHSIPLLGGGKLGEEQDCKNGCEKR